MMAAKCGFPKFLTALEQAENAIATATSQEALFEALCAVAENQTPFAWAAFLTCATDGKLEPTRQVGCEIPAQIRLASRYRNTIAQALRSDRPMMATLKAPFAKSKGWSATRSVAAIPINRQSGHLGILLLGCAMSDFSGRVAESALLRLMRSAQINLDKFETEAKRKSLSHLFAALVATNEAIMKAETRADLCQRVCEAVVQLGHLHYAVVTLAEPDQKNTVPIAATGALRQEILTMQIPCDRNVASPRSLTELAFKTRRACVSNNYRADRWLNRFQGFLERIGAKSCGAWPLFRNDQVIGTLAVWSDRTGTFTEEIITLLQRIADSLAFALENFEKQQQRREALEANQSLTQMYAALGATNEAIMRAPTRTALCQQVCDAVLHGEFSQVTVVLRQDDGYLEVIASAGEPSQLGLRVPSDRPTAARVMEEGRIVISNECLSDERHRDYWDVLRAQSTQSVGLFPLFRNGRTCGVLTMASVRLGAFKPELVELMARIADNVSFALTNFDRTDEKSRADERIIYLATHDGLTGLPNRTMFSQSLNTAIELARRHERQFALLFIDLDRFKLINDSLGHAAGDTLLVEMAKRLRECVRTSDIVARLGGDEFVILLQEVQSREDVKAIADKILSIAIKPIQLPGQECRVSASIGIAMFPHDGEDEQTLAKNADMAMYRAKEEGKNGARFFEVGLKSHSVERLMLETGLRQALERDEFVLHYQPKRELKDGKITGVEALIRWVHPDLGMLSPNQFIPLAEETGLIVRIGRWVLQTACMQNMAWQRQGVPRMSVAVNLSARQFADQGLLDDIDMALAESGLPPELLELEITESMVMQNVAHAIEVLTAIKKRGVRLAMDDFGTGYSSMSSIKQFPVDTLKIDRSFIRHLPQDSEDKAIADAIITLGRALGLTIVAEGVETKDQESFLRDHACDEVQGYLFSKPVTADAIPTIARGTVTAKIASAGIAPELEELRAHRLSARAG